MQEKEVDLTLMSHVLPKQIQKMLLNLDRTMEAIWMIVEMAKVEILGAFQMEMQKIFHLLCPMGMLQERLGG